MNKALFLDRDGVINFERGEYTYKVEDFRINTGILSFIKEFQRNGYKIIIISNQGGIAKGIYSIDDVEKLHEYMLGILTENGITITEIYYCPHHPSISQCLCRKPGSLMLEKAIARFNINPAVSFFIGDSERDIVAAKKVKLLTLKIDPNEELRSM